MHRFLRQRPFCARQTGQPRHPRNLPRRAITISHACSLFLELPPELVDVNVHPTKIESGSEPQPGASFLFHSLHKALARPLPATPSPASQEPAPPAGSSQ